jgi:Ca2+-binding RTX toxin-like protein
MGLFSGIKKAMKLHRIEMENKTIVSKSNDCNGQTVINTRGGNDKVHVHQNIDGSVDVLVNDKESHHFTAEQAKNLVIDGGSGDDSITMSGHQLYGPKTNITVNGGSGNDYIHGGVGNDTLNGGDGHDTILGGNGNDTISGGAGNDFVRGGNGNDRISGGLGNDHLRGESGNDIIGGEMGDDYLVGGDGFDRLIGGPGNDRVNYRNDCYPQGAVPKKGTMDDFLPVSAR